MILLIDNYDSFVHNLARYVQILGHETKVVRNDAITVADVAMMKPDAIILSPGPCTPSDAGVTKDLIRALGPSTPILGVCLGHQAIGEVYGGTTVRGAEPVHGKASLINHARHGLFARIPSPFQAGRYHSLESKLGDLSPLKILATTDDGTVMAIEHPDYPVYGVQFHPESILTEHGSQLLENFLDIAQAWHGIKSAEAA